MAHTRVLPLTVDQKMAHTRVLPLNVPEQLLTYSEYNLFYGLCAPQRCQVHSQGAKLPKPPDWEGLIGNIKNE